MCLGKVIFDSFFFEQKKAYELRISDWISNVCSSDLAIERRASETILENVRVLAIDQTVDENAAEPTYASNFTLEVTPKQAEMLSVVREIGSLSISLRSLAKNEEELERDRKSTRLNSSH